jgi:DNA uptake protein ComE-like DNA-binding protein
MIVLGALLVIFAIRLILNPTTIDERNGSSGSLADQLVDRIDPNTAAAPELAAIPTLGEKRAQAIVDYRQRFVADHPGRLAFTQFRDLEHVTGIGVAMSETMEPYLIFPAQSSTQP